MNRLKVLKAAWFMAVALGEQPSRRVIQRITKATAGTAFRTQEVAAFLNAWQYIGQDGRPHLLPDLSPVGNHCESAASPAMSPEATIKNEELSPDKQSTGVQSESDTRADLEDNVEEKLETTSQELPLAPPSAPKAKTKKAAAKEVDLAAWAIRDALAAEIVPLITGMDAKCWKLKNSRSARDMAAAGLTAREVLLYWQTHVAFDGRRFVSLSRLQEHMSSQSMPIFSAPRKPWERPDPYAALLGQTRSATVYGG